MTPRLTVVMPTYQRRDIVLTSLGALDRQDTTEPYEIVVVVDGSADGTASAIRQRRWQAPLRVVEQEHRGLAAARNHGADQAAGEVLLFLDDDMEAAPGLVAAHLAAHDAGAEAAVGAMPLHPDSPRTLLSEDVGRWADRLAARCAEPGRLLEPEDILGGHLSIRRELFFALGGFDQRFTAGGEFGNEDVDLAHRLVSGGHRVVFRADAVSHQRFVVTAGEHLRRWRQVGKADMTLARLHGNLHPSLRAATLRAAPRSPGVRALLAAPRLAEVLIAPLRWVGTRLADAGVRDPLTKRLFTLLHHTHYWLGVAAHGGPHDGTQTRVLCWHAIADLSADPQLRAYGVPPSVFDEQLATLRRAGYVPVTPDEVMALVEGESPAPRHSFLITFDDCYADLATAAAPVVARHEAPAVAFAVTQRVGDRNRWDDHLGVTSLALAGWRALKTLHEDGWEVGAHSRTHALLPDLDQAALTAELADARGDIEKQGLPLPRLVAYPYGEQDRRVRKAAREVGYQLGFTVRPGTANRRVDPYAVPRIEIHPDDLGWRLRLKVRLAGRPALMWQPAPQRREQVRNAVKHRLRLLLGRRER